MGKESKKRLAIGYPDYYPEDEKELTKLIKDSFKTFKDVRVKKPFALITPFSNYKYSSKALAASYSQIMKESFDSIIILSPVHKMAFQGIALNDSDYFSTPLGDIPVDNKANEFLKNYNKEFIFYSDEHHSSEHSIEVQLPYIYTLFKDKVKIIPIIIGEPNTKFTMLLARALNELINKTKKKYLIVVTTDLSQGFNYETAKEIDSNFMKVISQLKPDHMAEQLAMKEIRAYGGGCAVTLLRLAEMRKVDNFRVLSLYNSGDIDDEKYKVNGYISAVMWY